jgi:hypothetical protein
MTQFDRRAFDSEPPKNCKTNLQLFFWVEIYYKIGCATGCGFSEVFVHSDSSDCAAATPDKDMGAGHAMFTITKTGRTESLCCWFHLFNLLA